MGTTRAATPATKSSPPPSTARWGAAAVGASIAVLVVALVVGGGASTSDLPGLDTDPGGLTRWGLPTAKVILDGAAAVTIGLIGLAVVLPAVKGELGGDALRAMRAASWGALVWALAAAVVYLLTLSDLLGQPVWDALAGPTFSSYTSDVAQGRAYASIVVLALALIPATRLTLGHGGAIAVLLLAIGTLIPPALVGHSSSGDYHHSATVALLVHLVGMAIWVGGLVALGWYAGSRGRWLARAARTFSPIALGCFAMVGASGLANAAVRMSSLADLVTTRYGWLLIGKVVALVWLGFIGQRHRTRTLAGLDAKRPGMFRRLAAGEAFIMAAAIGLAVALSRTEPPVPDENLATTRVRELLGYPLPPEFTVSRLFTEFYPDAVFGLGCFAAGALYLAGVLRLRRRGDRWPVGRTITWFVGLATVAFAMLSGMTTYGMTMMSVHMGQHLILMMVSPIFLVLGGPATLALRALSPARRGEKGPREYLIAVLRSRFIRILSNPIVALLLFVSGSFMVYFSDLFEVAMRNHTGHWLMSLHFLLVGYLFFEVVIGIDPLPKRPPHLARIFLQLAGMAFHAFFGLAIAESSRIIAADWYRTLRTELTWLPDMLADQETAGLITMAFGELPGVVVMVIIFVQWYRSDEREARRFDRREGTAEAERVAYNAYLASLAQRDTRSDS